LGRDARHEYVASGHVAVHNALRRQVQQPVRDLQVDVVEMRPDIRRRLSCKYIISKTEENTPQVNRA
jgi:hypothetical protein